jgi:hypothetical protein
MEGRVKQRTADLESLRVKMEQAATAAQEDLQKTRETLTQESQNAAQNAAQEAAARAAAAAAVHADAVLTAEQQVEQKARAEHDKKVRELRVAHEDEQDRLRSTLRAAEKVQQAQLRQTRDELEAHGVRQTSEQVRIAEERMTLRMKAEEYERRRSFQRDMDARDKALTATEATAATEKARLLEQHRSQVALMEAELATQGRNADTARRQLEMRMEDAVRAAKDEERADAVRRATIAEQREEEKQAIREAAVRRERVALEDTHDAREKEHAVALDLLRAEQVAVVAAAKSECAEEAQARLRAALELQGQNSAAAHAAERQWLAENAGAERGQANVRIQQAIQASKAALEAAQKRAEAERRELEQRLAGEHEATVAEMTKRHAAEQVVTAGECAATVQETEVAEARTRMGLEEGHAVALTAAEARLGGTITEGLRSRRLVSVAERVAAAVKRGELRKIARRFGKLRRHKFHNSVREKVVGAFTRHELRRRLRAGLCQWRANVSGGVAEDIRRLAAELDARTAALEASQFAASAAQKALDELRESSSRAAVEATRAYESLEARMNMEQREAVAAAKEAATIAVGRELAQSREAATVLLEIERKGAAEDRSEALRAAEAAAEERLEECQQRWAREKREAVATVDESAKLELNGANEAAMEALRGLEARLEAARQQREQFINQNAESALQEQERAAQDKLAQALHLAQKGAQVALKQSETRLAAVIVERTAAVQRADGLQVALDTLQQSHTKVVQHGRAFALVAQIDRRRNRMVSKVRALRLWKATCVAERASAESAEHSGSATANVTAMRQARAAAVMSLLRGVVQGREKAVLARGMWGWRHGMVAKRVGDWHEKRLDDVRNAMAAENEIAVAAAQAEVEAVTRQAQDEKRRSVDRSVEASNNVLEEFLEQVGAEKEEARREADKTKEAALAELKEALLREKEREVRAVEETAAARLQHFQGAAQLEMQAAIQHAEQRALDSAQKASTDEVEVTWAQARRDQAVLLKRASAAARTALERATMRADADRKTEVDATTAALSAEAEEAREALRAELHGEHADVLAQAHDDARAAASTELENAQGEWKATEIDALQRIQVEAEAGMRDLQAKHAEEKAALADEAEAVLGALKRDLAEEHHESLSRAKSNAVDSIAQSESSAAEARTVIELQLEQCRGDLDSAHMRGIHDQRAAACRAAFGLAARFELRSRSSAFMHWKLECMMDRLKLNARRAIIEVQLDKEALEQQKAQGERAAESAIAETHQRMSQQQMGLVQKAKIAATAALDQAETRRREDVAQLMQAQEILEGTLFTAKTEFRAAQRILGAKMIIAAVRVSVTSKWLPSAFHA